MRSRPSTKWRAYGNVSEVVNPSAIHDRRPSSPTTMYGSGSRVRKGASAAMRSRMLRRISRRLSGLMSSLKGSFVMSPRSRAMSSAPQEAAEDDAAGALVRRQVVRFALRIVEFLLPRLDVHVGVGELAEIDLRPRHLQARDRAFDRHVAEHEHRMSFRREPVHGIHRHAVPVGVDQLRVDPVAGGFRKPLDVQLAGGDHHLPQRAVNHVAIDVDVGEFVVGADGLNLPQRVPERAPVPQADVLDRRLVVGEVHRFDAGLGGKRLLLEAIETVRLARELDVVRDVRGFAHQLVRLHDEAVDVGRDARRRRRSRRRRARPPR